MTLTLDALNQASPEQALAMLEGVYEHSPWIAEQALKARPFASLAQLKLALANVVRHAERDRQIALLRAHPELAGKAMVAGTLTAESSGEQSRSGLTECSPEEFETLQRLNTHYNAKFGWPFILAVRGPHGLGLTRGEIIATFERRLAHEPAFELAECLRQVHRIAELRLNDRFGVAPMRDATKDAP
jgi:N-carbamoyl-L-amino-acid hydrolase